MLFEVIKKQFYNISVEVLKIPKMFRKINLQLYIDVW